MSYIYLVILAVIGGAISNFFLKKATADIVNVYDYLNINLLYGLLFLGVTFVAYYLALSKGNISIVYTTITSLTLILIVLMGNIFFNELLSFKHILAIVLIIIAIILIYV